VDFGSYVDVTAHDASAQPPSFLDVPASNPYYQAIEVMAMAGVIDGFPVTGGREFRPDDAVNRAQFAKMIAGSLDLEVDEDLSSPFTDLGADVRDDLYPHQFVAAAFAKGIIKGETATTFAPWDEVKRIEVVTMVVRAAQNLDPGTLAAPPEGYRNTWGVSYDAEEGPLARIAEYNGLLAGLPLTTTAADPWAAMPRGEVAQVLWNVMKKLGIG
jgi:S-layer homology domain